MAVLLSWRRHVPATCFRGLRWRLIQTYTGRIITTAAEDRATVCRVVAIPPSLRVCCQSINDDEKWIVVFSCCLGPLHTETWRRPPRLDSDIRSIAGEMGSGCAVLLLLPLKLQPATTPNPTPSTAATGQTSLASSRRIHCHVPSRRTDVI